MTPEYTYIGLCFYEFYCGVVPSFLRGLAVFGGKGTEFKRNKQEFLVKKK